MKDIQDLIIIWAGACWLFTSIKAPKHFKKILLEKNKFIGIKVLLSWWERANVTNFDIEPTRDYFWQNRKAMISIYNNFTNWDMMSFFADNNVELDQEDRGRMILKSWDSKELLACLEKASLENDTKIKTSQSVLSVEKKDDIFEVKTDKEVLFSRRVAVTCWWRSFMHTWTVWDWYDIAKSFNIPIVKPHRWLCWLISKTDFKEISWASQVLDLIVYDKKTKKNIYVEKWPLLWTHFWVSWPIIHNSWVAIWEYLNSLSMKKPLLDYVPPWDLEPEEEYIKENICLKIRFDLEKTPKSVRSFWSLEEDDLDREFDILNWRSWKEAKITWWWILLDSLDKNLQSKDVPWLYFWWEILDLTWKTWGFNLQLSWSTWNLIWTNLE